MGFFSDEWKSKSVENKVGTIFGITFVIIIGTVVLVGVAGLGLLFVEWMLGKVME